MHPILHIIMPITYECTLNLSLFKLKTKVIHNPNLFILMPA